MDVLRVVDAFCVSCDDVRPHAVMTDDPSSCFCNHCGTCQTLVAPLTDGGRMDRLAARRRGACPGRGEIWFSDRSSAQASRQLRDDGGLGRFDIWSHDRVLAGVGLLAEAMRSSDDVAVLHECATQVQQTVQGLRQRQGRRVSQVQKH